MDFPFCPKGWVPMTMEEKKIKEEEKCKTIDKSKYLPYLPDTEDEIKWKNVRKIAMVHGIRKSIQLKLLSK